MAKQRLTKEQICELVELERSPEEEWSELYREWKKAELEELWQELKRVEAIRLRRLQNRRKYIENLLGIRLKVRVPRKLIEPPANVSNLIEEA